MATLKTIILLTILTQAQAFNNSTESVNNSTLVAINWNLRQDTRSINKTNSVDEVFLRREASSFIVILIAFGTIIGCCGMT